MVMKRARMILPVVLLIATLSVVACGTEEWPRVKPELPPELESDTLVNYTEVREPCDCRSEYRNLYFGDLHAHTTLSYDAYIWKTSTTPVQAYEFTKGGQLALTPLDSNGSDTRYVRLSRPLDFVALTDHQEFLAEYYLCTDKGSAAYDTPICQNYREGGAVNLLEFALILLNLNTSPSHNEELCTVANCTQAAQEMWHTIVENAENAYDRSSACTFTAFPAYEYTRNTNVSDRNRNVIFRNAQVPVLPPSFMEQWVEQGLWEELNETCLQAENGCDCIAIPHNSNWANGNKFTPLDYGEPSSLEEQREAAALRARMEPLVEIQQHKGEMECKNGFEGVPDDPDCDFEEIREADFPDCGDTPGEGGGVAGLGCLSRYDYIRNVLKLGLSEWVRTGVNPYKLGIVGGTDDHNGIPGKVEEYDYPGHMGINDDTAEERLGEVRTFPLPYELYNPGGLTAVWAVENSRDALFEAFQRRETYSTSGPRITVRFFGGWEYPADMCEDDDFVVIGYERGVPMGGDLPARPDATSAPTFAVMAIKDPGVEGHPGADLQQIQIIKGWVDADGNEMEEIIVVAGNPENGASVDTETCERIGEGWETLCAVWTDLDFDPDVPSFYYVRVIENPSCSWRQYDCNTFSEGERPESCSDPTTDTIIQERAITSPIWYEPATTSIPTPTPISTTPTHTHTPAPQDCSGADAICNDGTCAYTSSACAGHGGVRTWLK